MSRVVWSKTLAVVAVAVVIAVSITVLLAAVAPTAKITSPANKARVSGVIDITAQVKGAPDLKYVLLAVDRARPGASNSPACTFEVDTRNLTDGPHKVWLEAFDASGLLVTSKAITIYVKNGAVPRTEPARPAVKRPARTLAKAPVAPARRVAAISQSPVARTVARAEESGAPAVPAPVTTTPGPSPEPVRIAARPELAPKGETGAAVSAGGLAAPPRAVAPSVVAVMPLASKLLLNGKPVRDAVAPVVVQGRMHGGFRALFTDLGAKVSWEAKQRIARSQSESTRVEVPVGSRVARVNGKTVNMGSAAFIEKGRTVIPVRFFADATGATLTWNRKTGVAEVRTEPHAVAQQ